MYFMPKVSNGRLLERGQLLNELRNATSQMILRDGVTQFLLDSRIGWKCVAGTAGCGLGMRSAPAYLTVCASTHLCIVDGGVGVCRG